MPRPTGDTKLVEETPYDTILTLAGSENLDVLTAGTSVKMGLAADVPYQPVSDSIVSVSDSISQPLSYTGTVYYPITNAFNGLGNEGEVRTVDGMTTLGNEKIVMTVNLPYSSKVELVGATTYGANGPSVIRGYGVNGSGELFTGFTSQQDNNDGITMCTLERVEVLTGSGTLNTIEMYGTTTGTFILSQVWIDGVMVVNRGPLLTLSGDTDLAYFRVGDMVQDGKEWIQDEIWSDFGNSNTYAGDGGAYNKTKLFNSLTTTHSESTLAANGKTNEYWVWEYPQGIPFSKLEIEASSYGTNFTDSLKINGESVTNGSSYPGWTTFAKLTPTFANPIGDRYDKN